MQVGGWDWIDVVWDTLLPEDLTVNIREQLAADDSIWSICKIENSYGILVQPPDRQ
jgi:hypothetical protein